MKKLLLPLLMLAGIVNACTSEMPREESMRPNAAEFAPLDDFAFNYSQSVDTSTWKYMENLDRRFAACDNTEAEVKNKTTEALVKSVLDYPLNYLVLFYNNPEDAVSLVVSRSKVHQELLKRIDAVDVLFDYYANADIDFNIVKRGKKGYSELPYHDMMFLEAFLASDFIAPMLSGKRMKVSSIVSNKLRNRLSNKEQYGMMSTKSILKLSDECGLYADIERDLRSGEIVSYTTIYTPLNHQPLEGIIRNDLTDEERLQIQQAVTNQYPNALIISAATTKYNCHSYAWYSQSIDNNVWLNSKSSLREFQLARYWTNDLYVRTDAQYAIKAYYSNADHSAIVESSNMYVSKWGQGPLVKHSPGYCPYVTTGMQYYFIPGDVEVEYSLTVLGNNQVMMGDTNNFSVKAKTGATYRWTVEYMNDPSASNTYELNNVSNDYNVRLKCNQFGAYNLRVDEYYGNVNTAYGYLIVISNVRQ